VSLDDVDEASNDRIRGPGAWAHAVRAIRLLDGRGLLPIVTATESRPDESAPAGGTYQRFHEFLLSIGVGRPRVKIIPVFSIGRLAEDTSERLTDDALEGFDRSTLQCAETRVVADGGIYACPILAGIPGARLSVDGIEDSFRPAPLFHAACLTCRRTGMTCANA